MTILSFYILICLAIFFFQEKILFYPEVLADDFAFNFPYPFTERYYETDNARIHALHFTSTKHKGIIYYLHGNAGSLRNWGYVAKLFLLADYDVLMIDYRGYGKSTGTLSEAALLSDALSIYHSLTKEYDESLIHIYGRSIGSSMATYVASMGNPAACILEAPFYSMYDLANHHFPWLIPWVIRYPLRTDKYIRNIKAPVYIFHGTGDEIIYYRSSEKLAQLLSPPSQFFPVKGGGHNNLKDYDEYTKKLSSLLE